MALTARSEYFLKKRLVLRSRFKALVRKVMDNYEWLGDVEDEQLGEDVLKNIHLLTMKKHKETKSFLTLYDKTILIKDLDKRTEEENLYIAGKLAGLKCFRRYSTELKYKLAASTHYVFYRPGRVIVKEFQKAHALYFIVSGTVTVKQQTVDPILGTVEDRVIGTMESGDLFGEVSLLQDIPRTATIETDTPCDLLMLKNEDFERVLKTTVAAEWSAILHGLSRFTYFENLSEIDKRECCILSKICVFKEDTIIVGGSHGNANYVHLILDGTASVLVQLLTDESDCSYKGNICVKHNKPYMPSSKSRMKFVKPKEKLQVQSFLRCYLKYTDISLNRSTEVMLQCDEKPHIVQVAEITDLACFCAGENLDTKLIVAKNDVTCLLIPYFWLMQKNQHTWTNIKLFWEKHIPQSDEIFKVVQQQKKWRKYSRSLIKKNTRPVNYFHNIPYSIRVKDIEAGQFKY